MFQQLDVNADSAIDLREYLMGNGVDKNTAKIVMDSWKAQRRAVKEQVSQKEEEEGRRREVITPAYQSIVTDNHTLCSFRPPQIASERARQKAEREVRPSDQLVTLSLVTKIARARTSVHPLSLRNQRNNPHPSFQPFSRFASLIVARARAQASRSRKRHEQREHGNDGVRHDGDGKSPAGCPPPPPQLRGRRRRRR